MSTLVQSTLEPQPGASRFYAGSVPWKGLGLRVEEAQTAEAAIAAAGLNWTVELWPSGTQHPDGRWTIDQRYRTIVRPQGPQDEPIVFAKVSPKYEPIQNWEAFQFCDKLVGSGYAIYHTAGSFWDGRRIWLLANLKGQLELPGDDKIEKFLLLATAHDGSMSLTGALLPIRPANDTTFNIPLPGVNGSFKIRHTKNFRLRVTQARRVMGLADAYYEAFGELAVSLAGRQLRKSEVSEYLQQLLPDPEDGSTARRGRARAEIMSLFDNVEHPDIKATAYAMLQATIEWSDHHKGVRKTWQSTRDEARLASAWYGAGVQFKGRAVSLLTDMVDR